MDGLATRLRIYFLGNGVQRATTIVGLTLTALGFYGLLHYQKYLFVRSDVAMSNATIAFSALLWIVPTIGIITLFLGAALMPIILVRLSTSRQLKMLPRGRGRLLLSALVTVALLATLFALIVKALYRGSPIDPGAVFSKGFVVSLLTYTLLYALLWLVNQARGALMLLSGTMLIIPCLAVPFRYVTMPDTSIRGPAIAGVIALMAGSSIYLGWPRSGRSAGFVCRSGSLWSRRAFGRPYRPGIEHSLILKLPPPQWLAMGQAIPIAAASIFLQSPSVWLFYFALCSAICGALASLAASRSRVLWLMTPYTRLELYRRIEALYWRQNVCCVGALGLLMVVSGAVLGYPIGLLTLGLPLLLAGVAAGTYLGLMVTAALRAFEAILATCVMLVMLGIGYYAERAPPATLYSGVALVALCAVCCRQLSRMRWQGIDWALNRPADA